MTCWKSALLPLKAVWPRWRLRPARQRPLSRSRTLRVKEHCKNEQAVVDFLLKRKEVKRIIHLSQQKGVHRQRADWYLGDQFGGLVGFELVGGKEAGRKFIDAVQLHYHVANIGDARSLDRKSVV